MVSKESIYTVLNFFRESHRDMKIRQETGTLLRLLVPFSLALAGLSLAIIDITVQSLFNSEKSTCVCM